MTVSNQDTAMTRETDRKWSKKISVSVLLATYHGDDIGHLRQAINSILAQTRQPDEIVIVIDGADARDQKRVAAEYAKRTTPPLVRIIESARNKGLASALNLGLEECYGAVVCRMDSDDIAFPERLEKQITFLEAHSEVGVVAGWQSEFIEDITKPTALKTCAMDHRRLARHLRWRCTISHPSVTFRRKIIMDAGGYRTDVGYLEDWDLWMRLIRQGVGFHALQEPVIHVRVSPDQRRRRFGWNYLCRQLATQWRWVREGIISPWNFIALATMYIPLRLTGPSVLRLLYRLVRDKPLPAAVNRH